MSFHHQFLIAQYRFCAILGEMETQLLRGKNDDDTQTTDDWPDGSFPS